MRHVRMLGLMVLALCVAAACSASAASANIKSGTKNPKIFDNCDYNATEIIGVGDATYPRAGGIQCIVAATETGPEAGSFRVGDITVPFSKQIVLQYAVGFYKNPLWGEWCEEPEHQSGGSCTLENGEKVDKKLEGYVPPTHGVPAIAPTPEKVPGEPIAHISATEQEELGWPESLKYSYGQAQKHHEVKTVYETIELAGVPATNRANLAGEEGTAVEAPVMVKGENKWIAKLGDVCYIGSAEEPIVQHLTSGASESPLTHEVLHGTSGLLEFAHEAGELIANHSDLVDNTYAVPGAKCTGPYSSYIAATIDRIFQIPEPAGASVTQLKGDLYDGYGAYVEEALG